MLQSNGFSAAEHCKRQISLVHLTRDRMKTDFLMSGATQRNS